MLRREGASNTGWYQSGKDGQQATGGHRSFHMSMLEVDLDLSAAAIFGRAIDAGARYRRRLFPWRHPAATFEDTQPKPLLRSKLAVVDILFHPVITTRRVVERDSTSRSGYIAHTVNPSNVQIKNELQMSNDHNTKQGCQVRGPTVNSHLQPTVSAPTHPPHPQPSESPDRPASQMNRLSLETPVSTTKTLLLWLS